MLAFMGVLSAGAVTLGPPGPTQQWGEASIRFSRFEKPEAAALPPKPRWQADPMNLVVVVEAGDHHVSLVDGDRFEVIHRFASRNALHGEMKFTPDGKITVTSSVRGNDLCVEVADTGIGIESENLQKIFEAFFQKTPSTLGIGVGLTISKEIVALHEGEIWAESGGAGQGSVFRVIFPSYPMTGK